MSPVNASLDAEFQRYCPVPLDDLIRLGRDGDGGYVISERSIQNVDVLVGLGINTDWSFEDAVMARGRIKRLFAVDGSVSADSLRLQARLHALRFWMRLVSGNWSAARRERQQQRAATTLYRKFVSFFHRPDRYFIANMMHEDGPGHFSWPMLMRRIDDAGGGRGRMFVKMDIEGAEYRVIPEMMRYADRIEGLAIEFHDCDLMWERFTEIMASLDEHFVIAHIHGNNCAPLIAATRVPRVLEISLVHRSMVNAAERGRPNRRGYPLDGLDMPNSSELPDFSLSFGLGNSAGAASALP